MGWQQAPIDALVHDGVSGDGSLVYHRAQILAVLDDPSLGPRVGIYRHAGFFRSHEARVRIVKLTEQAAAKIRLPKGNPAAPARKKTPRAPMVRSGQDLLLRSGVGEPGKQWVTAAQLYAARWSKVAVSALIPENVSRPNGNNWEVLYHRAQIDAVRNTPSLGEHIGQEDAAFWRDRTIRSQVRALQHRSRRDAQDNADSVDAFMRSRRTTRAEQARMELILAAPRTAPAQPPAPARRPAAPARQVKKTPGVHGAYPPDLGPDPRIRGTAPAADLPPPKTPGEVRLPTSRKQTVTQAERARQYRRLVETAQQQLAKHRGQRRSSSDEPVRIAAARRAVIMRSEGMCENPRCPNPDMGDVNDQGGPLLDVDHIGGLAATGDDEAVDMIALCPNCHRIKGLGQSRHELIPILRETARRRHADLFSQST
ncbi:HNH endonuclease signature motif containing protein [Streptomyces sp. NPDC048331]|uniref:HNH endonuclease signature motif containing protein n=1 Tax=Streptomyces sp. NPDC048331 TaxID=3365534 RepID=UPI003715FA10